jgi:hypothetical protein
MLTEQGLMILNQQLVLFLDSPMTATLTILVQVQDFSTASRFGSVASSKAKINEKILKIFSTEYVICYEFLYRCLNIPTGFSWLPLPM